MSFRVFCCYRLPLILSKLSELSLGRCVRDGGPLLLERHLCFTRSCAVAFGLFGMHFLAWKLHSTSEPRQGLLGPQNSWSLVLGVQPRPYKWGWVEEWSPLPPGHTLLEFSSCNMELGGGLRYAGSRFLLGRYHDPWQGAGRRRSPHLLVICAQNGPSITLSWELVRREWIVAQVP